MSLADAMAEHALNGLTSPAPSVLNDQSEQSSCYLEKVPEKSDETRQISPSDLEQGSTESQSEGRQIHGIQWILVCLALYISALLYGLDTTIAADVQASVVDTFGSVEQLTWLGTGFPLGSVAVILLIGSLYAKFDQKWIYVGSIVLFEAGSVLCGAAPSMTALIVGRVIAGMGGAGIYLGALNYFSEKTSPSERGAYIAGIGLVWGVGCILGPIIGGAFSVSSASWRWAFYINLPIAGIFSPVYLFFLPSINLEPNVSSLQKLTHIDWLGFLLSAGVWIAFTLVLTFAGTTWDWADGRTIALFVVFGVLLVLFVLQQYFQLFTTRTNRLLPLHLLGSRTQVVLYVATSATTTALFVPLYYLPLFFQFVANDTALDAAVRILPLIIFFVVMNMAAGVILPRIPYYALLYLASGVLILISSALFYSLLTPTISFATIYGLSILSGIGAGLVCQTGYSIATIEAPAADAVNAISLQNISQIGSIVIGLVISGQVFQSVAFRNLNGVLAGMGFSEGDIRQAIAGSQSVVFEALTGEVREKAVKAITDSMGEVFVLVVVAGALLIVSSVALRWKRMN